MGDSRHQYGHTSLLNRAFGIACRPSGIGSVGERVWPLSHSSQWAAMPKSVRTVLSSPVVTKIRRPPSQEISKLWAVCRDLGFRWVALPNQWPTTNQRPAQPSCHAVLSAVPSCMLRLQWCLARYGLGRQLRQIGRKGKSSHRAKTLAAEAGSGRHP